MRDIHTEGPPPTESPIPSRNQQKGIIDYLIGKGEGPHLPPNSPFDEEGSDLKNITRERSPGTHDEYVGGGLQAVNPAGEGYRILIPPKEE